MHHTLNLFSFLGLLCVFSLFHWELVRPEQMLQRWCMFSVLGHTYGTAERSRLQAFGLIFHLPGSRKFALLFSSCLKLLAFCSKLDDPSRVKSALHGATSQLQQVSRWFFFKLVKRVWSSDPGRLDHIKRLISALQSVKYCHSSHDRAKHRDEKPRELFTSTRLKVFPESWCSCFS